MTEDDKSTGTSSRISPAKVVSTSKDFVALLRDSVLFLFAMLLLIFPSKVGSLLSEAGFEEGSFAGFKWKPKVEKTVESLNEAGATITELKKQNEAMSGLLKKIEPSVTDSELKKELIDLEKKNERLDASTSEVQKSVTNTIESNAQIVKQVQNAAETTSSWGVVFGGDTTPEDAKPEVESATKLGISNASIYFRQKSYRSVAVADTRSLAEQILLKLKTKPRRADAYIVNMSTWCPKTTVKDGYQECNQ
jgi:hypothetical protein